MNPFMNMNMNNPMAMMMSPMMMNQQNPMMMNQQNPMMPQFPPPNAFSRAAQNNLSLPPYQNSKDNFTKKPKRTDTEESKTKNCKNCDTNSKKPNTFPQSLFSEGGVILEEIEIDDDGNELNRNYRYLKNRKNLDTALEDEENTYGGTQGFVDHNGNINKSSKSKLQANNIRDIIKQELNQCRQNQPGDMNNMMMPMGNNNQQFTAGQMVLYKQLADKMYEQKYKYKKQLENYKHKNKYRGGKGRKKRDEYQDMKDDDSLMMSQATFSSNSNESRQFHKYDDGESDYDGSEVSYKSESKLDHDTYEEESEEDSDYEDDESEDTDNKSKRTYYHNQSRR